ncbi:uncharacterized protein LOC119724458 [Patiria miniata]|uniref:Uncharacterized protein n=1 Tax=Patiria miniata TaxID=46514 RepID=A0A913ZJC0_PATMI|nr:uncharacterized protein LOC119724458 [Patiria miniata]
MKLLPVLAILLISCDVLSVQAGSEKPAIFKKWSACKKYTEYVMVVKDSDRSPGEKYYEREMKKGKTIQYYVCLPCTQCASGVRQLQPCMKYHDTNCSATECAVAGCVLDEMLHDCRLPGDPDEFPSISAMMDPCDPTKAPVNPTPIPPENPSIGSPQLTKWKKSSTPLPEEGTNGAAGGSQKVPNEPKLVESSGGKHGGGWGTLETVVSVIVVALTVNVTVVGMFVYYRRSKNVRLQSGRGRGTGSSSGGILETTV